MDHLQLLSERLDVLEICIYGARAFIEQYEASQGHLAEGLNKAYNDLRELFEQIESVRMRSH